LVIFKKIGGLSFLYHFHSSPRISYKNIIYNLTFDIYFSFFIFYVGYHFGQNIFITYKIFIFWELFLRINLVPNFSHLPKVHNIVISFWCTHLAKILKCKKLYFVTIILRDFNVFKCHVPMFYFQSQLWYRFLKNLNIGYEAKGKFSQNSFSSWV